MLNSHIANNGVDVGLCERDFACMRGNGTHLSFFLSFLLPIRPIPDFNSMQNAAAEMAGSPQGKTEHFSNSYLNLVLIFH